MTRSHLAPKYKFKTEIRREHQNNGDTFSIICSDGVKLKGATTFGHVNGINVFLLEFDSETDHFRWMFKGPVPESTLDVIRSALRHDPSYREQFKQPAVPAKEVDSAVLATVLFPSLGEHVVLTPGSAEPGPHTWESRLKVLAVNGVPKDLATFVRKCPYLSLSKTKGTDSITVSSPLGSAHLGNALFLKILDDYANGALGTQADYKLIEPEINTWPSKPTIISPQQSGSAPAVPNDEKPGSLEEQIQAILERSNSPHRISPLRLLKSGRDEYSRLKLEDLVKQMSAEDAASIRKELPKQDDQVKAMRWVLRGLPAPLAIEKIELDNEATTKLVQRNRSFARFDSDASSFSR